MIKEPNREKNLNYDMEISKQSLQKNFENSFANEDIVSIPSESDKSEVKFSNSRELITPVQLAKKRIKNGLAKTAATTTRKKGIQEVNETAGDDTRLKVISTKAHTAAKNNSRSKQPPPSQLRIDTFFKSCTKSYKVEAAPTTIKDEKHCSTKKMNKKSRSTKKCVTRDTKSTLVACKGRKRLFKVEDEGSTTTISTVSGFRDMTPPPQKNNRKRPNTSTVARGAKRKRTTLDELETLINLCSDDEAEEQCERNSLEELKPLLLPVTVKNEKPLKKKNKKNDNASTLYARGAKRKRTTLDELETLINLCSDDEAEEQCVRNSLEELKPLLLPDAVKNEKPLKKKNKKNDNASTPYEMPCTSSYSASKIMQSSAMVTIPVPSKSTKDTVEKFKDNRNAYSTAKNKVETIYPVLKESSERIKNENNIQIKVEPDQILAYEEQVTQNISLKIATLRTNRVKVEKDIEIPVTTPPTPPRTSTDTCSSINHISNLNACATSSTNVPQIAQPVTATTGSTSKGGRVKKVRVCPPYKIVAGTTFAVDAFHYGQISGVTHYFLTHFHADHYQGLTRKFAMPLYVSPLTARLVRALIPVDDQYLHEIELNTPLEINGVEVTAIDANHCPGAVLFVFKLSTGRCILHTGDFRASPDMESEPIFWNNTIDTIYLDTTYIAHKHNFCTQYESIDRAKRIIEEFHTNRPDVRILYICGSYVIGKERFWTSLAHEFGLKVWTEKNRLTALRALDLEYARGLLCDDPYEAQMHVISIGKVSYHSLVEYFRPFQTHFDVVLAFRPSGWEKNSKPSLRSQINIVGVEYSEHSSHAELERFVTYLKPREVISTVPVMQGNPCITPKIPDKWYKYDSLKSRKRNFQPSITSFMTMRPRLLGHTSTKRTTNCVTPKKSPGCRRNELSQLSVRAMATYNEELQADNDDVVATNMLAGSSKNATAVVTLFPDLDAFDDWIS